MIQKYRHISEIAVLLALLFASASCSDNSLSSGDESNLTENQEIAVSYFKEIALGFEHGNSSETTRKWNTDLKIYVGGEENQVLLEELDDIIADLNSLILRDNIQLNVTSDSSSSNFYIFLGPGQDYEQLFSPAEGLTDSNWGLFYVYWNSNQYLNRGAMYVDTNRPQPLNQRHLLREELTQSLGMAQDSPRFTDSIFQISYDAGVATEYSLYDEAVIQLLYHPEMRTGLNETEVDPILRRIVGDVIE